MPLPISDGLPPITVADKGGPLTCADHDMNLARLLDRRNHTGTQLANTISDLKSTVLSWPELNLSLETEIQAQLDNLTHHIFDVDGHVQSLLDDLAAALRAEMGVLRDRVSNLESSSNNLLSRVNILETKVTNHEADITALQAQADANDADNMDLWDAIRAIPTSGYLPLPVWRGSIPGQSTILVLQYDTINDVVYWGLPYLIEGGTLSDLAFGAEAGVLDFGGL